MTDYNYKSQNVIKKATHTLRSLIMTERDPVEIDATGTMYSR